MKLKLVGSRMISNRVSAFAVIFALSAIALFPILFMGYSLWPTDAIFGMPPWNAVAPEGYRWPSNSLLFDNAFLFYPWFHKVSEMLQNGELPLWNPAVSCGLPLFANSTGFFFPLNVFFYVLPLWYAFGFVAFLKLFFAGFFTYFFLRRLNISSAGALVSAVSFMFCGFMTGWLGHPHTHAALCLPLLFLLAEKVAKDRNMLSAAFFSIGIGCAFFAGHYETTFHVLAGTALYCLFRLVIIYREEKKIFLPAARFAGAGIIGIGIAAVQLFPAWEYINLSSLIEARGSGSFSFSSLMSLDSYAAFVRTLKASVLYLIPDFYGNPADHNEWGSLVGVGLYPEQSGYIGVVPFFLAISAIFLCRRNRNVLCFASLGFLSLAIAYRMPLIGDIVYNLPIFAKLNNNRIILLYSFAVSVLAGFGIDFLADADARGRKKTLIILGVLFILSISLAVFSRYVISAGEVGKILSNAGVTGYISGKVWFFIILVFAGLGATLLYLQGLLRRTLFHLLLFIVTAADLLLFFSKYWPVIRPEAIYPTTPAIEFLKKDADIFRVFGLGNVMSTNTWVPFGFQDIRGYDGIELRNYEEFITGKSGEGTFFMGANTIPRHINLMNVKYVLMPSGTAILGSDMEKVYSGEIDIYRNRGYLKRAFVVHKARIARSRQEAFNILYSGSFDPVVEAVIGTEFLSESQRLPEAGGAQAGSSADVVKYASHKVAIEADMKDAGLLVLSDTFYPGWKAYVDGIEKIIYRTDYNFRSVFLEKGRHRVEFRYQPESFQIGIVVSFISFCMVLAILVHSAVQKKKKGIK